MNVQPILRYISETHKVELTDSQGAIWVLDDPHHSHMPHSPDCLYMGKWINDGTDFVAYPDESEMRLILMFYQFETPEDPHKPRTDLTFPPRNSHFKD